MRRAAGASADIQQVHRRYPICVALLCPQVTLRHKCRKQHCDINSAEQIRDEKISSPLHKLEVATALHSRTAAYNIVTPETCTGEKGVSRTGGALIYIGMLSLF